MPFARSYFLVLDLEIKYAPIPINNILITILIKSLKKNVDGVIILTKIISPITINSNASKPITTFLSSSSRLC
ncbi:MAG: hypothetical protein SVO01_08420, partial [Thermotogota bacterium]|nr:hypothetical protein [Thermotogota bacterium]